MIQIDKQLIEELFAKAEASDRKRMNYDLRTSANDNSQRMLNALLPGTVVPIHRHPMSNENVICLCGKLVEVLYEEVVLGESMPMGDDAQYVMNGKRLKETARYMLDPTFGNFGVIVPAGVCHTMEVLEPTVIYEAKDGKYGEDGSETFYPLNISADFDTKGSDTLVSLFAENCEHNKSPIVRVMCSCYRAYFDYTQYKFCVFVRLNLFAFFETDVLFSWPLEGENSLLVFTGDGEVTLGNDIHSDDEIVFLG